MEFAIEPHRGLGPVSFGMTRAQVAAAMAAVGGGPPQLRFTETDCFFGYAFQVSFGDAGRADFVEVASHLPGGGGPLGAQRVRHPGGGTARPDRAARPAGPGAVLPAPALPLP